VHRLLQRTRSRPAICRRRRECIDIARGLIEGTQDIVAHADRRRMIAGGVDRIYLCLQQEADAPVGAGLAQSPRDFADHARAFTCRCECVLENRTCQRLHGAFTRRGDDRSHRRHGLG
jgi:hypothetical protein